MLPRRQELEELEPSAFYTAEEVKNLPRGPRNAGFPMAVLAVSHSWESVGHPDPDGRTLVLLAHAITTAQTFQVGVGRTRPRQKRAQAALGAALSAQPPPPLPTTCPAPRICTPITTCIGCPRRSTPFSLLRAGLQGSVHLADPPSARGRLLRLLLPLPAAPDGGTEADDGVAARGLARCSRQDAGSLAQTEFLPDHATRNDPKRLVALPAEQALVLPEQLISLPPTHHPATPFPSPCAPRPQVWYAHQLTTCFFVTDDPQINSARSTPYHERGWPTFEYHVAAIGKAITSSGWPQVRLGVRAVAGVHAGVRVGARNRTA